MHEETELFLSLRALCRLFGRAERTIREWAQKAKVEKVNEDGVVKYHLPGLLQYYLEHIYRPPASESLEKVKLEQEKLKLRKMELELAEREGRLVEREKVEVEWAQRVAEMGARLAAMPFRLTPKLADRQLKASEVQKLLKTEVREFFKAYAREGEYTPAVAPHLSDQAVFELCWKTISEAVGYEGDLSKVDVRLVRRKGRGGSKRKGKKGDTKA